VSNSDTADGGTDSQPDDHSLDLGDYPDGTAEMIASIHTHGPYDVGDGLPRREIKHTTDLSKSQVRTRADKLLDDGYLIESRVDVGQAHPEIRYRLKQEAKEVAAACAESFQLFGTVPDDPGRDEFLEVLEHVSRLRREEAVAEEARSLGALVDRVSAVEDRLDTAEDDRKVLHSRADKGLAWMATLARAVTQALDDVIVGRCSQCAEFGILNEDPVRSPVCDDCQ